MSKKKRRKKNVQRNRAKNRESKSLVELSVDLREALDGRRGRKSLEIAKSMLASPDSSAYLPMITSAYELRAEELLAEDQIRQVDSLFQALRSKNPACFNAISQTSRLMLDLKSGRFQFFNRYGDDPETSETINQYLRRELRDLRFLTEKPGLSQEHPLRVEAAALLAAWREIEGEIPLNGAYEKMLKVVGRRSPLLAWRLHIQGLRAFYAGRVDEAQQAFKRIPPESPLFQLAETMMSFEDERSPDTPLARRLRKELFKPSLKTRLEMLDQLMDRDFKPSELKRLLEQILTPELIAEKPGLCSQILANVLRHYYQFEKPTGFLQDLPLHEKATMIVEHVERFSHSDSLEWYLEDQEDSLDNIQKALLYDRIATINAKTLEEDTGHPLSFFDQPKKNLANDKKFYYELVGPYWEKSVEHHSLPEVFAKWHAVAIPLMTPSKSDEILEKWHRCFPEDSDALFALAQSCRKRQVFRKVEKYVDSLDNLIAGNPQFERFKLYLKFDEVLYHINKKSDYAKALKIVEQIPEKSDALDLFGSTLLQFLKSMLSVRLDSKSDLKAEINHLLKLEQPVALNRICSEFNSRQFKIISNLEKRIQTQEKKPEIFFKSLSDYLATNEAPWNEFNSVHMQQSLLRVKVEKTTLPSAFLWACFEKYLARKLPFSGAFDFFWDLATVGLQRKDEYLPHFLAIRALSLSDIISNYLNYRERDMLEVRLSQVLAASFHLAQKWHQNNLLQLIVDIDSDAYLDEGYREIAEGMNNKKVRVVVERENKSRLRSFLPNDKINRIFRINEKKPAGRSPSSAAPFSSSMPKPTMEEIESLADMLGDFKKNANDAGIDPLMAIQQVLEELGIDGPDNWEDWEDDNDYFEED